MNVPSVRQLECLVAVAAKLNFRLAAEECFISQPALSAQIQQLESLLGLKLFERDRRRVLPTPAGEVLARKASRILAQMGELAEAASAFAGPLTGSLNLGVIPTVAPYVLPRALKGVHRRFPEMQLRLHEGQTEQLVGLLNEGAIEVALLALEADLGDLETMPLFQDPFVLAVPLAHPLAKRKRVTQKDLLDEEVLLLDDGHCLRDQALPICHAAGATELGDFRATSLTTLVQMVSGGLGVTLLPEISLAVEAGPERQLGIIPFSAKGPARTIGLAWRASSIRKQDYHLLAEVLMRGIGLSRKPRSQRPSA